MGEKGIELIQLIPSYASGIKPKEKWRNLEKYVLLEIFLLKYVVIRNISLTLTSFFLAIFLPWRCVQMDALTIIREYGLIFICEYVLSFTREYGPTFISEYALTFTCEYALTFIREYVQTFISEYVQTFIREYVRTFIREYGPTFISEYALTIKVYTNHRLN